jgi:hypothetical protein
MTYRIKIADDINETDTVLNVTIQSYLDTEYRGTTTVSAWRIANYEMLRQWAYPDITIYNDAQVKINSGITALEEEGEEQLEDYVTDCLAVKTRFPKS